MALPEPVWSEDDIEMALKVIRNPSSLISSPWSKDPTKLAILRALESCQIKLLYPSNVHFRGGIVEALTQKQVCFLHSYSLEVDEVHY